MCEKKIEYIRSKTAIIVTTYNPVMHDFKKNIQSYINQVNLVVVCDNTEDSDLRGLISDFLARFSVAKLISMHGNEGIGAAQNSGIQYAVKEEFEYLIEVDQDSKLSNDYVKRIIASYLSLVKEGESIAGIGPLAVNKVDGSVYGGQLPGQGVICVSKTMSSGFFFTKAVFDFVGPKDESLFIDFVDWDWCWRARALSFDVFVDTDLKILHLLGNGHRKILLWNVGVASPFRLYYQYRNGLRMLCKPYVPFYWKLKLIFTFIIKIFVYVIFFGDRKERIYFIMRGIFDFFKT